MNEIRFSCRCGATLAVAAPFARRRVRCPACRAVLRAEAEAPQAALIDEAPRAAARAATCGGWIAASVAIATCAWILGFILVASHTHDSGGLALLGVTYLVAPGAICRLAARRSALR